MMSRIRFLAGLVAAGAMTIAVGAYQQPPAAQGPRVIDSVKLKDNLYVLTSSTPGNAEFSGGNVAVFITDGGVTLVDTKLAAWGPALLDAIKKVTSKPVTRIINTHTHGDHTGNDDKFGATVDIVAQENTKANMAKMDAFKGDKAQFLPKTTYKDKLSIGSGKDRIDLYYFGVGHTNGDTFVVFPALRTMHVGDTFAWKALPYVDAGNGGSVIEGPKTLAKAIATVKNVDTIINGHIPTSTINDLKEYAAFLKDFADLAQKDFNAGKTAAQAADDFKVDPKYKGYVMSVNPAFGGARGNMEIAYKELKK